MSLSPLVRKGVSGTATWLSAQFVGTALGSQNFRFSSKSMFVEPEGFCTRDQNSWRNLAVPLVSWLIPNTFRSLLFGGIEPDTIFGLASSSDVPPPKASSVAPVGLSACVITPDRIAVPVPPASQSMHGLAPFTARFAFVSISKLLPVTTLVVEQFTAPAVVANATVTVGTASASDRANAARVTRL